MLRATSTGVEGNAIKRKCNVGSREHKKSHESMIEIVDSCVT